MKKERRTKSRKKPTKLTEHIWWRKVQLKYFHSLLEIPPELQLSIGKLANFSNAVLTSLDELETKVTEAKKILMNINKLSNQKDFLSREQIEEKKEDVKERLMRSLKLHDEIKSIKSNPGFLSDEDFQLCLEILQESLNWIGFYSFFIYVSLLLRS